MKAAISCLESDRGFLLQVEGGRVDHAAHASDGAALIWEQLDFDDAVRAALDYARRRGDTLVVLCSDHGNSNPGLNAVPHAAENLVRLSRATNSYATLASRLKKAPATGSVKKAMQDVYGIQVSDKEAAAIGAIARGEKGVAFNKEYDTLNGVLGQTLCNHFGLGWVGKGHTSDHTVSTATGPGAAEFSGLIRNTEVFEILTGFMGSSFRNPAMDESEFRQTMTAQRWVEQPHWT
jgi:alkaline phosphatase